MYVYYLNTLYNSNFLLHSLNNKGLEKIRSKTKLNKKVCNSF